MNKREKLQQAMLDEKISIQLKTFWLELMKREKKRET